MKNKIISIVVFIIFFTLSFIGGYHLGKMVDHIGGGNIFHFFGIIILFYLTLFIQIIVHEGGHLVFGLMSGYKFSSFRIGKYMIIKKQNKLYFKLFNLAGTGGQCLLSPPSFNEGKIPYMLYNLGGCIANLMISLICLVIYFLVETNFFIKVFLICMIGVGILFTLMNGIPMNGKLISNDGYNTLLFNKNKAALYSLWLQLKINEQLSNDVSLKNMPSEWFYLPAIDTLNNKMVSTIGVFYENYLFELEDYNKCIEVIDQLLNEANIVGLYRNLLIYDKIYCQVMLNQEVKFDLINNKENKTFMKQMKSFPVVLRTNYLLQKIHFKNEDEANKVLKQFEKNALKYPYTTEIENERKNMEKIDHITTVI